MLQLSRLLKDGNSKIAGDLTPDQQRDYPAGTDKDRNIELKFTRLRPLVTMRDRRIYVGIFGRYNRLRS